MRVVRNNTLVHRCKRIRMCNGTHLEKHNMCSTRNATQTTTIIAAHGTPAPRKPAGYWKEVRRHRRFFDEVSEKLGIQRQEDWYNVSATSLQEFTGGNAILSYHQGSITSALPTVYPEFIWYPWNGPEWKKMKDPKIVLEFLVKEMDIKTQPDWFQWDFGRDLEPLVGRAFHTGAHLIRGLKTAYPMFLWHFWLFNKSFLIQEYWGKEENRHQYLDWLADKLQITYQEDWYHHGRADLQSNRGSTLLAQFGGSYIQMVQQMFPQYTWHPWMFGHSTQSFWKKKENRESYLTWFAEENNIESPEQWYRVTQKQLRSCAGRNLIDRDFRDTLAELFPGEIESSFCLNVDVGKEVNFKEWMFTRAPKKWWSNKENVVSYLNWVEEKLCITCPEDWFNVSVSTLSQELGGSQLLHMHGNIANLLSVRDPHTPWDEILHGSESRRAWGKTCHVLMKILQSIPLPLQSNQ